MTYHEFNNPTIIFCQPTLNASGSENSLLEILAGLRAKEPKLTMVVLAGDKGPMQQQYEKYAHVKLVSAPKLRRRLRIVVPYLISYGRLWVEMRRVRIANPNSVLYVNTLMFPQAILAAAANRLPVVVHVREVATTYPASVYAVYFALAAVSANELVGVCDYIFQQPLVRCILRIIRRDVSVIYNSSAFPVVAEPKSLSINLRILAVIPLSKRKGSLDLAHFVVEFDRKYKELNFVVDVVGCLDDTRLYTELRKVVSMEGCEHRLRFHGTMSHDELGELYRKADVLLHPSHTEAFPRVLVEAMNHGLPCVATNVGGSGEAVVHGITGFLVPVGNIDEMTRSVMKILTNQSLHEKMSKASLKRYQKLFVRKSMVEQVLRIVSSVATRVNIKGL